MTEQSPAGWPQVCGDLRAEAAALRALIDSHRVSGDAVTSFHGWRVCDKVRHFVVVDRLAHLTMSNPVKFAVEMAAFIDGISAAEGRSSDAFRRIIDYESVLLGPLSWHELLTSWDRGLVALCEAASAFDVTARVAWVGSEMRAMTLLNARQMEVWSHGQDVFDLYRVRRPETDRLKNVVEFGIRTFAFCFANHGMTVPNERPYVELLSPSGARWSWNSPQSQSRVTGSAIDFCLVATRRRNIADTAIKVVGETAETWMRIVQCSAGPPSDGPAPGERVFD